MIKTSALLLALILTTIAYLPVIYAISSPALCVEGDYYTENNCVKECVNGGKVDVLCCNQDEQITHDDSCIEGQIYASEEQDKICNIFKGYYCRSIL